MQLISMEAVFLGALLNPLLPFILGVLRERHQLRQGIEKDITFIKDELPMIAAAIEQHQSADVKSEEVRMKLIEQLRELAHDMELCIGLFVHARARKRLRVQQLKKLKICFRGRSGPMGSRTQFARALQELKERSKEVKARAEDNTATGTQSAPSLPREPDEPELRLMADTVGMDAALDHVLQFVHPPVDPKEEEKKHRVICIVGPAGVGKTLLANRAYNCMIDCVPLFSPHICVRAADMAKEDLFRSILRDIGIDDTARFKRNELRNHLHGKRFLVVIDDLQNTEQWECIKSCFPVDRRVCSRVIVTTTSQSVADACSSPNGYVYKMRSLNESDSTSLFIREAYLEEHRDVVADVSAGVRRKCDGLPLALVSIARFVREKGGLDSCEGICRELGSYLHRERTLARMNWALESKYNSLDGPALKACLLYFSTLDCAQPILRDSTVRRWVSEGFVDPYPRRNCTLLNEQYNNWETLIDRNIIKPTVVGYNGKVKACQPAGTVLEYISYKSMVQEFVAFHDQIPPPKHTRWLSLHNCRGSFSDLGESHPRTLTISGQAGEAVLSFANSELMQVLDLEQCTDVEDCHMDKICNLLLLRYLSLGAKISKVPRKIKNLGWLETLDLRNTRIHVIPKEVILIPHLTHLLGRFQLFEGDYSRSESKLKEFMQNKSKLETLAGFVIGTNLGFPQLMHLMRQLRKVKIICSSDADPTNLVDLTAALRKFLSDGTGMSSPGDRSLSIDFHECSTNFRNSECFQNFIESLRNVSGSLHSLKLSGLGEQLSQTISFVRNIGGIMELYLSSSTLNWNSVIKDGVINFRRLRYLKLVADEIQGDAITIGPNQLRGLKRLCLVVKGRLPQIMILDGALQYLVSLHLVCKTLDGSPNFTIKHLTMLKEVALHSEVTPETKYVWNEAARRHPNKPSILFIDYPRHAQQMTQPIPPNLASSAIANAPGIHSNTPLLARVGSQIAATTAATN